MTLPHHDAAISMHVVTKRIIQADREFVVYCFASSDSNGRLNGGEGAQVQGRGCTVIKSVTFGNDDGSERALTMMQSVVRVTFGLDSSRSTDESAVANAAVLRSIDHHFDRFHQLLENLVLAESFLS